MPQCLRAARACQCAVFARVPQVRVRRSRLRHGNGRRVTVTAVDPDQHAVPLASGRLTRDKDKLRLRWDLTSDMSGGFEPAQLAQTCPLDREVRCLPEESTVDAAHATIVLGELSFRQCDCRSRRGDERPRILRLNPRHIAVRCNVREAAKR